jgi:hypothetical protein
MITSISTLHKQRFEEIRKTLQLLGCKESQFVKIELLFFEALNISRAYGDDPQHNTLLTALKDLQHNQYEKTKVVTKKPSQREMSIRRFIVDLRKILSSKH